jgi:hypothetical protein
LNQASSKGSMVLVNIDHVNLRIKKPRFKGFARGGVRWDSGERPLGAFDSHKSVGIVEPRLAVFADFW